MGRRPVCLFCMLLMLVLCLADISGIPLIRGNPLPESLKDWIERHPDAVICGEVQQVTESDFSQSVYLKQVQLSVPSEQAAASFEKISIENVRVYLKKSEKASELTAGSKVTVSGSLFRVPKMRNPGEFDSQQYYACRHIYYFMKNGIIQEILPPSGGYRQMLLDVREHFLGIYGEAAGDDSAVFEAMVLGKKENLDEDTRMQYQLAGIIHILAISGMHIMMIGMGLNQLLLKMGAGLFCSGMISVGFMIQYGVMTGGSAASMRAVCMFLLLSGARLLGKCYDSLTALAVSALLLVLSAPANLCSSGFLLSYGAVLGVHAGSVLQRGFGKKRKWLQPFLASVGVQLATLPVLLYFYGEASVAGLLLNLAVVPTVSVVLASGVLGGILGLFWMEGAKLAMIPGRVLLYFYDRGCSLASEFPWCTWTAGRPEFWQMGMYILCLLAALYGLWKASEKEMTGRRGLLVKAGCMMLIFLGIAFLPKRPEKGFSITCLDVGQGDAIVLETSEGAGFLIDGGSSSQKRVGKYQILPFLKYRGISRLDGILISHGDQDHISGIIELLTFMEKHTAAIRADRLILPKLKEYGDGIQELIRLAEKVGMKVEYALAGDCIRAGELQISILWPADGSSGKNVNEEGLVAEVAYGNFKGLFTGDIGLETEKKLLPCLSDVDFLKVGHHGSANSSGREFLEKIRPETGVISCAEENSYGHPSAEAVSRLEEAGCFLAYTMKGGAVTCRTDGRKCVICSFQS